MVKWSEAVSYRDCQLPCIFYEQASSLDTRSHQQRSRVSRGLSVKETAQQTWDDSLS